MMNPKDVITLNDNNKYVVVSKTNYEGKKYYYLVDINNEVNMKFCFENNKEDQIELVEISDQSLIQKLIVLFMKEITKNSTQSE